MQETLNIKVENIPSSPDLALVKFKGDLDKAGFGEIKPVLDEEVKKFADEAGKMSLIFDFAELGFINSESIGYLMEIHTHLSHRGKKLIIVGANAHVADVLTAIGMTDIVPEFPTLEDFLKQK